VFRTDGAVCKQARQLSLDDELKKMKRVLRRLGHTDEDNVIQLKGQTASQISTADELIVTELMFNGVFGVRLYSDGSHFNLLGFRAFNAGCMS